jgi:hypothetical protein
MATEKKAASSRPAKKTSKSSKSTANKSSASKASAPRAEAPRRAKAGEVARNAAAQLVELTGKEPESIAGLERAEDGWTVMVEVLEVRRIPATTDVLALYEVSTDDRGDLESYRRVRRYTRGAPGEE